MQHHYHQTKLAQSSFNQDIPFLRQAVTLIDQCTKLMKDDRIALRNKLKQYFKQLKQNKQNQNQWQNQQMQILIQIFVEANKKKSLNKLQKGDKVMDWLQIKLRKYIDNHKKQRHRKQVQQFRTNKYNQSKKSKQNHHFAQQVRQTIKQKPLRPNLSSNINKLSFNKGSKRSYGINQSLSKSRDKDLSISTRKNSQNKSFNSSTFNHMFSQLKKTKNDNNNSSPQYKHTQKHKFQLLNDKVSSSNNKPQTKPQLNNISNSIEKKFNNFLQKNNKYSYKSYISSENQIKNHEFNKISQLFNKKSNGNVFQNQQDIIHHRKISDISQPYKNPFEQNIKPFQYQYQLNQIKNEDKQGFKQIPDNKINNKIISSQNITNNKYQYQGLSSFNSFIKNSLPSLSHNELKQPNFKSQQNYQSNSLFTSPDLLAQCRKFLSSSNQKPQLQIQQIKPVYNNIFNQDFKVMTFSNTINRPLGKFDDKQSKFNPLNINQVISENNSLQISVKKPNIDNNSQVIFKMKVVNINSIQQLLLQMFKNSNKVSLDKFQLGQIMSRCDQQTLKYLESYCDILSNQLPNSKFNIDFVSFIKYLYTYGKVFQSNKQYFSIQLCQILDIQKKGQVDNNDIEGFLQSIQNSQLQPYSYTQIKNLLTNVYKASCCIQNRQNVMTYWSLYFLQLKKDKELEQLNQILNKFQFQYDTQQ